MAMPAWYIAMWVNSADTRDVADRPDAVRRAHPLVHLDDLGLRVHADGLQTDLPHPSPAAHADEQLGAPGRRAAVEPHRLVALARDPLRPSTPLHSRCPRARSLGDQRAGLRLLRIEDPVHGLDTVTRLPNRANVCASSSPIAPPPSTTSDSGTVVADDRLPVGPVRRASASPAIGGTTGADPVAMTMPRRVRERGVADNDPTGPSRLGAPRTSRPPLPLEPVGGDLVVPVVGRLVADALRDGPEVGLCTVAVPETLVDAPRLGQQVRAADHHLAGHAAPVGALPTDQLPLDADDRRPASASRPATSSPPTPIPMTTTSTCSSWSGIAWPRFRSRSIGQLRGFHLWISGARSGPVDSARGPRVVHRFS